MKNEGGTARRWQKPEVFIGFVKTCFKNLWLFYEKFARPLADGVSEKQQQSSSPPFLRSSELPLALAKGLRRAPDPGNFRGPTSTILFFSLLFSMFVFDFNLLRFSTQHDPILDPKLAPINPSFALLFPITFPPRFPTSF